VLYLISAAGFGIAAAFGKSEIGFLLGSMLGIGVLGMSIPLQTHYLRANYGDTIRGRLFSFSLLVRALTAMGVSYGFGKWLDLDFGVYPMLLWIFAGCSLIGALSLWRIPSTTIETAQGRDLPSRGGSQDGESDHSEVSPTSDGVLVALLIGAMLLGIGVLSASALRVDYLASDDYGWILDAATVSWITGVIPSLTRLGSTLFWGWLFDRADFFRIRIGVNLLFLIALALYFLSGNLVAVAIGSALFGLARGGGEILFNLWVTKVAAPEQLADYMSKHTFLAGLRILLAPFIGFVVATQLSIPWLVGVASGLVIASIICVARAGRVFRRETGVTGKNSAGLRGRAG
ncbi:MAG: MFS transporter, partial [Verrucomicrobiota bacterium]